MQRYRNCKRTVVFDILENFEFLGRCLRFLLLEYAKKFISNIIFFLIKQQFQFVELYILLSRSMKGGLEKWMEFHDDFPSGKLSIRSTY